MNIEQIRKAEQIVQEIVKRNGIVYTKLCKLEDARKICGLRAMFDEAYPDPVRVVSVGEPVENLENDPLNKASLLTSVEFCGGTYVNFDSMIFTIFVFLRENYITAICIVAGTWKNF